MKVPKEYLVSLFNEMAGCFDMVAVEYPVSGTLFDIKLDEQCTVIPVAKKEYERTRGNYLRLRDRVHEKEYPFYADLVTCFYASGILRSSGEAELKEKLKEGVKRDFLKGNKPLFIGYDTNSLRHRTNVIVERMLSSISRDAATKIGICLNESVKHELRGQWDHKYKKSEVDDLGPDFRKFLNQHPKNSRLARIGAVEYKHLLAQPNTGEASGSGTGDNAIISSYETFIKERNVDLLLISGDNDFVAMAHDERIPALFMRQPVSCGSEVIAGWDRVVDLLYCAAVVFGHIILSGISIYGVWTGKVEEDWDNYHLFIERSDDKDQLPLFRDLEIIARHDRLYL
jgi:hypothetical protein